jgi:hypothetical protein
VGEFSCLSSDVGVEAFGGSGSGICSLSRILEALPKASG